MYRYKLPFIQLKNWFKLEVARIRATINSDISSI